MPTTLLGMVDAAVGGKTGINTAAGKNLVGSFHEPAGVICDLDLLGDPAARGAGQRLGRGDQVRLRRRPGDPAARRVRPGGRARPDLAGARGAGRAGRARSRPRSSRRTCERGRLVARCSTTATPWGTRSRPGRRTRVRHGEAVALGMVYVAELARLAGRLDEETAARHASTLELVGLPTRWHDAPFADLLRRMRRGQEGARRHDPLRRPRRASAAPSASRARPTTCSRPPTRRLAMQGLGARTGPTSAASVAASPRSTAPRRTPSW